jgi:phenylalanyl-tRNA synthetase beta chain
MNISHAWLRAIAPDLADSPRELADRLAMFGAAVDDIIEVGRELEDIRIARVVEANRHPNADRLSVCIVNAGAEALVQVVCGAPNVRAGAWYPFIPVGGTLPGGMQIRRAKIRGEESQGMLCSARELGLGRDHEGILELHGSFTPGEVFLDAVGLRDSRLVLDVTPNRPDLLSHWGVAREAAPGGEASLHLPTFPGGGDGTAGDRIEFSHGTPVAEGDGIRITLEDVAGCPRYYGVAIRGVRIGPSPEWLASRLRTIGVRPINNVVDATNYVLHELGQPLHAFDLNRLGTRIVVRRAREGESLRTLDGEDRTLGPHMLVIADATRPVALAGVMGGEDTEVNADTKDVLLECALFDAALTRATRTAAGLSTDASYRFERGVDPTMMERAVRRAVDLIVTVAGGDAAPIAPLADAGVPLPAPIELRTSRVRQVLGVDIPGETMRVLLEQIGFQADGGERDRLRFRVPGHRRHDVLREDDLVEEVARRYGYDRFPDELRPFRPSSVPDDTLARLENRLREWLVSRGLLEARTAAFAPEAEGDVPLLLPLSAAESRLRRALLPGLLRRVEYNFNRGAQSVRLYELGTVFLAGSSPLPAEETRLAAVITGPRAPRHWSGDAGSFDLWDLRGLLDELARLVDCTIQPAGDVVPAGLDAGVTWALTQGNLVVGAAGRFRADAVDSPPWADPVYGFEITLTPTMLQPVEVRFQALPAHPAIERDLALVVPAGVSAATVEQVIRQSAGPLLEAIGVFDVYSDERLGAGQRSIAFRLRFRAADRTLQDTAVDRAIENVLQRLSEEHRVERRG